MNWGRVLLAPMVVMAVTVAPVLRAEPVKEFRQAITQTVLNSPRVNASWYNFEATREAQSSARAAYLPSVDVNAEIGEEDRETPLVDIGSYTRDATRFSITQMLFDGFQTREEVARLGYEKLTRYYDLKRASEETALEAARAYVDTMRYQKLVKFAENNYVVHRQIFDRIAERSSGGVSQGVDLEQAAGRVALAESNLLTEMTNLHDVRTRFQRVVGDLPADELAEPAVPSTIIPRQRQKALNRAYEESPEISASIENLRAAQAAKNQTNAPFMPRLDLRYRNEREHDTDGVNGRFDVEALELVVTYNLFRGGADSARKREYYNRYNAAIEERKQACLNVRQNVMISFNDISALEQQLIYLNRSQMSQDRTRRAYRDQFDLGRRSLLDLLDSQNEFFDTQRAYTAAQADLAIAKATTLSNMGLLLAALEVSGLNEEKIAGLELDLNRDSDAEGQPLCPQETPNEVIIDKDALFAKLMASDSPDIVRYRNIGRNYRGAALSDAGQLGYSYSGDLSDDLPDTRRESAAGAYSWGNTYNSSEEIEQTDAIVAAEISTGELPDYDISRVADDIDQIASDFDTNSTTAAYTNIGTENSKDSVAIISGVDSKEMSETNFVYDNPDKDIGIIESDHDRPAKVFRKESEYIKTAKNDHVDDQGASVDSDLSDRKVAIEENRASGISDGSQESSTNNEPDTIDIRDDASGKSLNGRVEVEEIDIATVNASETIEETATVSTTGGPIKGSSLSSSEELSTASGSAIEVPISFRFNSYYISVKQQLGPSIANAARILRENPESKAVVEGHTDSSGSDQKWNLLLSSRRANAVRDKMIKDFAVNPDQITAVGYGSQRPIMANKTSEGRKRNRRVVLVLDSPDSGSMEGADSTSKNNELYALEGEVTAHKSATRLRSRDTTYDSQGSDVAAMAETSHKPEDLTDIDTAGEGRGQGNKGLTDAGSTISYTDGPTDEFDDHSSFIKDSTVEVPVKFRFNSYYISVKQKLGPDIARAAKILRDNPEASAVIEGHTDSSGSDPNWNVLLSSRRANAVRDKMIKEYGVNPDQITAIGYGAERPVARNSTRDGRQKNRRVVLVMETPETGQHQPALSGLNKF